MLVLVTTLPNPGAPLSSGPPGRSNPGAPLSAGPPGPTTTQPGAVITIPPGGTAPTIIGPHNDSSDFWALGFALLGIVVAIIVVRLVFRTRIHPSRLPDEKRPGGPDEPGASQKTR